MADLVQATARDGLRLDGAFQAPMSDSPSPLAVDAFCLIHGTRGNFYSSTLLESLAERLLGMGCAVLRANTRGHDGVSTSATSQGGKRQGAAYEVVDECRYDLAGWVAYLRERVGPRIGLLGHSLGAVKCLYAAAHDSDLRPACVIAVSPPRLSYAWFCSNPQRVAFLDAYSQAERLAQVGQAATLLDVTFPLPFLVTAAGYLEKYGPDERYNFLRFVESVDCPVLATFGSVEVENNVAFRGAPESLQEIARRRRLQVKTIPGADHFYTNGRGELCDRVEAWLQTRFAR